jgi:hypothetical protein
MSRRRLITGVVLALMPLGATASAQEYKAQQAQAGAVALLGMRTVGEDGGHEGRSLRADGRRPLEEARRCPFEMVLMRLGHVGGIGGVAASGVIARVSSDTLAVMKGFDRRGADADLATSWTRSYGTE